MQLELYFNSYKPVRVTEADGGVQYVFKFDNGYGASVIQHKNSYGGDFGLWELAVVQFYVANEFMIAYDTPITNDVLSHLTTIDVCSTLDQIQQLKVRVK